MPTESDITLESMNNTPRETVGHAASEPFTGQGKGRVPGTAPAPRAPGKVALRRVLVVEDDDLIRTDIEDTLNEGGFEVAATAFDLRTALECVAQGAGALDCALLDVDLGGKSCLSLAASLDAVRVPYLLVTAHCEAVVREMGFQAPVLEKPFRPGELSSRLAQLLENPAARDV